MIICRIYWAKEDILLTLTSPVYFYFLVVATRKLTMWLALLYFHLTVLVSIPGQLIQWVWRAN